MSDVSKLVDRGCLLDAQIEAAQTELKQIRAELIKKGAGEYLGSPGKRVLVVMPGPKIVSPTDIETAKEIAGPNFSKLFARAIVYKPVQAFRNVAGALLGRSAPKLVRLCEKECSPSVIFND